MIPRHPGFILSHQTAQCVVMLQSSITTFLITSMTILSRESINMAAVPTSGSSLHCFMLSFELPMERKLFNLIHACCYPLQCWFIQFLVNISFLPQFHSRPLLRFITLVNNYLIHVILWALIYWVSKYTPRGIATYIVLLPSYNYTFVTCDMTVLDCSDSGSVNKHTRAFAHYYNVLAHTCTKTHIIMHSISIFCDAPLTWNSWPYPKTLSSRLDSLKELSLVIRFDF